MKLILILTILFVITSCGGEGQPTTIKKQDNFSLSGEVDQ